MKCLLSCLFVGGLVSSTKVNPVRVWVGPSAFPPKGSAEHICNVIETMFDSGTTEVLMWGMSSGVVAKGSPLESWMKMTSPTGQECIERNKEKGIVSFLVEGNDGNMTVLTDGSDFAKANGFNSIYWVAYYEYPGECTDSDVSYITTVLANSAKVGSGVDISVVFGASYISPTSGRCTSPLLKSLDETITDTTHLRSIEVQYFDEAKPFTTYESIFVESMPEVPGASITELNDYVNNLKGYFGVLHAWHGQDLKNSSDLVPLPTLKQWVCKAQSTIGYTKGLELHQFDSARDDSSDMINSGLGTDCDQSSTSTTSTKPISASAITYSISLVAVTFVVLSLLI